MEEKKLPPTGHNRTPAIHDWLTGVMRMVKDGEISVENAVQQLSVLPYEDLDFAKLDHHRSVRTGFPEVVLGRGKTVEQIEAVSVRIVSYSQKLLVTHAVPEAFAAVKARIADAQYNPVARTIVVNRVKNEILRPGVTVVTGGTADIPIAEEAAVTAEIMGNQVQKLFDVGVAGIHRLLDKLPLLRASRVLVAVAGMEGALPSVLGGLVSMPVIAVPASIGYGANFSGLAPLLTMLNSCAPGVCVVNIDNGFGAGYIAGLINLSSQG
ncbi:MAG TPA: nickel pincer cofactor biosynthesis protein LarB [Dehalococcoidales bacterium]|nr:nickel pincer cofactor biosynthesis protein LarB [Dehalococcoidales bacterium]